MSVSDTQVFLYTGLMFTLIGLVFCCRSTVSLHSGEIVENNHHQQFLSFIDNCALTQDVFIRKTKCDVNRVQ